MIGSIRPPQLKYDWFCQHNCTMIGSATRTALWLALPLELHYDWLCHQNWVMIGSATRTELWLALPPELNYDRLCHQNCILIGSVDQNYLHVAAERDLPRTLGCLLTRAQHQVINYHKSKKNPLIWSKNFWKSFFLSIIYALKSMEWNCYALAITFKKILYELGDFFTVSQRTLLFVVIE